MANAGAHRGNNILLSDYLLEHLSKREVDRVLAHELAHLKRRHPLLLLITLISGMATAGYLAGHLESWFHWLAEGWLLPFAILGGLALFYLVARRFERRADAEALQLTNDPEALIRALAKITTLNRVPLHWGRVQNTLITHPSTLQRVRILARQSGISDERLTQLLSSPQEPVDYYPVPLTSTPEGKVFSTTFKSGLNMRMAWSSIAASTLTPALVAFVTTRVHLPVPLWSVLAFGCLATVLLTLWITNIAPMWVPRYLHCCPDRASTKQCSSC